ncbi:pyruvate kinase [Metabacillus herbersteinensis]|uniref:Pyruvate kinase n=1 Tax=Metabacillus herbersteinensis TaxID=283816 RepID=A0ABV6G9Y4_9BACI
MRKTKIICTIGPTSQTEEKLQELSDSGMDIARLNFSHGTHDSQLTTIQNIRHVSNNMSNKVEILMDIKGPKIRLHKIENDRAVLKKGQTLSIYMKEILGNSESVSISYPNLIEDVEVGTMILVDDGTIRLRVIELNDETKTIVTQVQTPGTLKNDKGVNVPGVQIRLPGITEKDRHDILFGIENGIDYIAASYIRKAADIEEVRELLKSHHAEHIKIIAKIENQEGVTNVEEIIKASDGIMVARGDLGVEVPIEEVPFIQKKLIAACNLESKLVIVATQMLDSMQRNPIPTRAEVSDVANAVLDGTNAVMLSGETAVGTFPVASVDMMDRIVRRAERGS